MLERPMCRPRRWLLSGAVPAIALLLVQLLLPGRGSASQARASRGAAHRPVAPPPITAAGSPSQATAPSGLESLYDDGVLLQDRNGDSHLDFLDICFDLPDSPSDTEVAAAANVAARLGFEVSSLNLPLSRADRETCPGVAVTLATRAANIPAAELEPGVGVIAWNDDPVAVTVTGGDDAGTAAAAMTFAARLPFVWEPDGATLADITDAVRTLLTDAGVIVEAINVRRLAVRSQNLGLDRADVRVTVSAAEADAATAVLESARQSAATTTEANVVPATDDPVADDGGDSAAAVGAGDEQEREADAGVDLRFPGLRLLRVDVVAAGRDDSVVWIDNESDATTASGRRPGGGNKTGLDLSNLYANGGFFSDTDSDLVPDRVDVLLTAAGAGSVSSVDLAARLGLEATGITVPIAKTAGEIDDPESEPPLVIIGADHPLIARLIEEESLEAPPLDPGEGWIGVVREAFGDRTALVVLGGDAPGLDRAVSRLAEDLPYLLYRGKDRPTVADVEDALWRAVSSRSPIGQAATALYKLDTLAPRLDGRDLERLEIAVHVEKADPGLGDFIRARAAEMFAADEIDVVIGNIDVQNAIPLIDESIEVPSEVDTFWQRFNAEVIPAVRSGEPVEVVALLSEAPEVRARIAARARSELLEAGAAEGSEVTVLSAYKQGYSWLYDYVRPRIDGQQIRDIRIRFAEIGAPAEWPQQAMYTPTRWLLEIFPIDEVLARDLGLDLEQIAFEKMPKDAPTYEVIATGADGEELFRDTFEPHYVLRDYFDRFPDYEKARVTTGWIRAETGGQTVIDERIVTDLERFWDHFQGDTLMKVYDHVMRTAEGAPRSTDAPHFGELRIDVTLSEPDYQIGVDKEQVASMEALHEEIYFSTLHFFDVMGRLARGQALSYPGRVIPIVRPKADGEAGSAHITFTGFASPRPRLTVTYTERGGRPQELRRELPDVDIDRPEPLQAWVSPAFEGIAKLGFYVKVDFEQDRRDEFARRTSVGSIDARITNSEQVTGIIGHAAGLHAAGLYPRELAFHGLGEVELTVGWERDRSADTETIAALPRGGNPAPLPDITALLPASQDWRDAPLVQWNTPMPPAEAYGVLAKMDTFAEGTAYQVGESYLGKPIWAIDLMAPLPGSHWSQAKATTRKPTVIYSARQHANEVSSTSHVLKLGEILLTGDEYPDALDRVNVVIHPITNPDGAQLAYDLHQITPDHMLHAGYLGSLGVDVTSGQGSEDPIYPETNVRPKLWNTWLPDLFLNPHGYPSHEWVQVFSEYAAWVRTRATESRDWWGMRGWFMPSFSYLDDPDFPDHKAAAFEIRDRITEKINAASNIRELNDRAYDRYRRYAFAWDQDAFKLDFTDDVLIYTPIVGGTARAGGMSNPNVTVWSGTTEAPDETAYGEWLELVATGGLQWDKALLEYLLEGNHVIERDEMPFAGGMTFRIDRPRPATDPDDEEEDQGQRSRD